MSVWNHTMKNKMKMNVMNLHVHVNAHINAHINTHINEHAMNACAMEWNAKKPFCQYLMTSHCGYSCNIAKQCAPNACLCMCGHRRSHMHMCLGLPRIPNLLHSTAGAQSLHAQHSETQHRKKPFLAKENPFWPWPTMTMQPTLQLAEWLKREMKVSTRWSKTRQKKRKDRKKEI